MQLDEAAEKGTRFAFTINMLWSGAKTEFGKAKQEGKDYIALFANAAQTDQIHHLGFVESIEASQKTTKIEFSQIIPVQNKIWKWDIEKLSGGKISKDFIRPYSLCKTPDFNSFPKLKIPKKQIQEEKQEYYALEGALTERITKYRERDRKLIRLKIDQQIQKNGNLNCAICGFSFETTYGMAGKDFCEVHHIRVLSENNEGEPTTTLDDLAVLCSNCHRIIHRKEPAYTIDEIKALIKGN
jgi:5-methylcytosine-specific restriction endonuclease McrA